MNIRLTTINLIITLALLGTAESAKADYPADYYNSLNGKCGVELVKAIRDLLATHTEISYSNGTWTAFRDTDVKTENGTDYWWDMYSDNLVAVSSGHPGLNVEHSVANSWWGGTKNAAYKDIVHLNPSNSDANSRKSNYPLAELSEVTWTNGVTNIGHPKSGQGGGANYCYEPADQYKGDFARVFMYMFTVYGDISWKSNTNWMYNTGSDLMFKAWASEMLLRWHAADPVSDKERKRNDGIYKHQKNRNPFIDLPDLADHIWGAKYNVPYDINGGGTQGGGEDPEPPVTEMVTYDWLSQSSSTLSEGWTFENTLLPSATNSIWSWKSYGGAYYLNASAFISNTPYASESRAWSGPVDLSKADKATLTFEHAAKFQTTLRSLCGLEVRDLDSGDTYPIAITSWPSAGAWTFTSAGTYDLTPYCGHRVQIGLRYASDATGADTWEIRNMRLSAHIFSGIDQLPTDEEDADNSFLVEVWGRNILTPDGAVIFDLNGRRVEGSAVEPGIYIVAHPGFKKSVKVMVK